MINTITLNPSLDYIVKVDDFKAGHVNRTSEENIYPGGKGINVSIVLKNLGVKNRALGFVAGFTGEEIEKLVKETREELLEIKDETISIGELSFVMTMIAKQIADVIYDHPNEKVNSYMLLLSFMQSVYKTLIASSNNERSKGNA